MLRKVQWSQILFQHPQPNKWIGDFLEPRAFNLEVDGRKIGREKDRQGDHDPRHSTRLITELRPIWKEESMVNERENAGPQRRHATRKKLIPLSFIDHANSVSIGDRQNIDKGLEKALTSMGLTLNDW